ncbi:MAG: PPC domain-containing protein [Planctomycetes bacterium]|nr:PPC domain-containing protein [Planctomycetota bacterium]MBI3846724.1 PPC domain-containing protein [Planctomycetota bacterium]
MSHPFEHAAKTLLVLALVSEAAFAASVPESESNDTPETANVVRCNDLATAAISPAGDKDVFRLTLNRTSDLAFYTTTSGDSLLELFASDGTTLIDSDDDSGEGLGSHLGRIDQAPGVYFIRVSAKNADDTFSYSLRFFCPSIVEELEPNDDIASASPASCVPGGLGGDISDSSDLDYWSFSVGTASHVAAYVFTVPEVSDHTLTLYRGDGTYLGASHVTPESGILGARLEVGLPAGDYVWRLASASGPVHYDMVFRCNPVTDCLVGNVNTGDDVPAAVLSVNGATDTITVAIGEPIAITLAASPSGPDPAEYVLWTWPGLPTNPFDLRVTDMLVGCTANPTPFNPTAQPQPFRCMKSSLMADEYCDNVRHLPGPTSAPFTVTRNSGYPRAARLTLQAVIQDDNSSSPLGYSVTNAVILKIQ